MSFLLALLLVQSDAPWEGGAIATPLWTERSSEGDVYWIERGEIERTSDGKWLRLWMRGVHGDNVRVAYRKSLWRLSFDCDNAKVKIDAMTTYRADGSVLESEDYPYAKYSFIRPDSIYLSISEKYCSSE